MNVKKLDKNILYDKFEKTALKKYYNLETIIFNSKHNIFDNIEIDKLSTKSIRESVIFYYCFYELKNIIFNISKDIEQKESSYLNNKVLFILKYLIDHKKTINYLIFNKTIFNIIFNLYLSGIILYKNDIESINYKSFSKNLNIFISFIIKSLNKFIIFDKNPIEINYSMVESLPINYQHLIKSLSLSMHVDVIRDNKNDEIIDLIFNFITTTINNILKMIFSNLDDKNKMMIHSYIENVIFNKELDHIKDKNIQLSKYKYNLNEFKYTYLKYFYGNI